MTAMKMGKHVFVQKPLTHTIKEARLLAEEAKKRNVVTQMGNQGHSQEGARLVCEWIWDGAIGDVREAHVWTNRPIWPQGIDAPKEIPSVPADPRLGHLARPRPWRPYHPAYLPFNWRGWWDFGTGALGDMGAHLIDQPFWALKLGHAETVQASSLEIHQGFLSRGRDRSPTSSRPAARCRPVKMIWYDGGLMPARPGRASTDGRMMGDDGGGCLFVGGQGHDHVPHLRRQSAHPPREADAGLQAARRRPSRARPASWRNGSRPSRPARSRRRTSRLRRPADRDHAPRQRRPPDEGRQDRPRSGTRTRWKFTNLPEANQVRSTRTTGRAGRSRGRPMQKSTLLTHARLPGVLGLAGWPSGRRSPDRLARPISRNGPSMTRPAAAARRRPRPGRAARPGARPTRSSSSTAKTSPAGRTSRASRPDGRSKNGYMEVAPRHGRHPDQAGLRRLPAPCRMGGARRRS